MRKIVLINILFLFIFDIFDFSFQQSCLKNSFQFSFVSLNTYLNRSIIKLNLHNFDTFDQINSQCLNSLSNFTIKELIFKPNKNLELNSNFSLNNYLNKYYFTSYLNDLDIYFFNIKSFKYSSEYGIQKVNSNYSFIKITILDSVLDTWENCSSNIFGSKGVFNGLILVTFTYSVKYSRKTCPYLFKNTVLSEIFFYGLSDCLIKRNILEFIELDRKSIGFKIKILNLSFFKGKLGPSLLSQSLFEDLQILSITGLMDDIDKDAFRNLKKFF